MIVHAPVPTVAELAAKVAVPVAHIVCVAPAFDVVGVPLTLMVKVCVAVLTQPSAFLTVMVPV